METKTENRTDFLIPKRGFFSGFASINVAGNTADFNSSTSGEDADCKAIKSDWEMIGQDLKNALKNILGK